MRQNIYISFNKNDCTNVSNKFYCVALEECQEIINSWTKKLLMGSDGLKWVEHSKNLIFARQCINFENREYRCGHIKYDIDCLNEVSFKEKSSCSALKTIIPARSLEKIKVYKFVNVLMQTNINEPGNFVSMVGEEIMQDLMGDEEIDSDCDDDTIESSNETVYKDVDQDSLHQCVCQIFNTNDEIDTNKNNQDEVVNEQIEIQNENRRNNTTCHRLSLVPIFKEGIDQLTMHFFMTLI